MNRLANANDRCDGSKSAGQAQRFLAVYGVVGNLFRLGRHLTRAIHYRELRSRAFCEWQEVTRAQIMA